MAEQPTQARFLTGNLFWHVTLMSLTSSVGLMVVFAVDFVDMIFISMLGKAELAAAIGYAGSILFFTGSFGIGVAIAAGALVSRALGAGDTELARQRATSALVIGGFMGAVFAAIVWLNVGSLVGLLGAVGQTRDLAVSFMHVILPSLPVLLVGVVAGALLRAYGDGRRSMYVMIAGGVVNAVLDPILIFGLDLELTGAALSSTAARFVIAGAAFYYLRTIHNGLAALTVQGLLRDLRPVAAIAAPAILTQLATPVGQAFVTRAMAEHGEDAVAGMAVVGRLTPVAFGVIFALSGAVGPIIGQNAGAGQWPRVKLAFREALIFTAIVTCVVALVLFLLRAPLEVLFQLDGVARQLVFLFAGPLALLWFFNGSIFVGNAAFNNLGKPLISTWINWGRHTLGTIPFVLVGSAYFGAQGVLIGQGIGGVAFGLLALVVAKRVIAKADQPDGSRHFQRHHARFMSVLFNRR